MRISDWSSDVCSSDLLAVVSLGLVLFAGRLALSTRRSRVVSGREEMIGSIAVVQDWSDGQGHVFVHGERWNAVSATPLDTGERVRSEEHTSELQSLMSISYAVFCLKKKQSKRAATIYKYRKASKTDDTNSHQ